MATTGQDMRFCGRYGQLHYRIVEPTHPTQVPLMRLLRGFLDAP
jgi:hypothetical protein